MNIWWIFSILWIIVVAFFAMLDTKRVWQTRKKNSVTKQDVILRTYIFLMVFVLVGTGVPMLIKALQGELSLPFVHAPSWVLAITLATAILESIIASQHSVFVLKDVDMQDDSYDDSSIVEIVVRFGKDDDKEEIT